MLFRAIAELVFQAFQVMYPIPRRLARGSSNANSPAHIFPIPYMVHMAGFFRICHLRVPFDRCEPNTLTHSCLLGNVLSVQQTISHRR
jgi:hypothetical protein